MSGTRLDTKVEDLASSLTVITKEQMSDFALLDLDDIFLYDGTEGTGNFTDYSFDRNGAPVDNTQLNPGSANRIRGVGPANTRVGATSRLSGRVPIDPIDIDSVEISRGPNANVFGLGSAAGTVNVQPATANLRRDRSQLSARTDNFGGYRTSLDLNRVLKPDVLALRGSAVAQHDGFSRKPSGTDTRRYQWNGAVSAIQGYNAHRHMVLFPHGRKPAQHHDSEGRDYWLETGGVRRAGIRLPPASR
jgi:outer membrane receptor protein involved in Fe transport